MEESKLNDTELENSVPFCRICSEPASDSQRLVVPCKCKGTIRHVHVACLNKWLETQHRDMYEDGGKRCEVCNTEFRMETVYTSSYTSFMTKINNTSRPGRPIVSFLLKCKVAMEEVFRCSDSEILRYLVIRLASFLSILVVFAVLLPTLLGFVLETWPIGTSIWFHASDLNLQNASTNFSLDAHPLFINMTRSFGSAHFAAEGLNNTDGDTQDYVTWWEFGSCYQWLGFKFIVVGVVLVLVHQVKEWLQLSNSENKLTAEMVAFQDLVRELNEEEGITVREWFTRAFFERGLEVRSIFSGQYLSAKSELAQYLFRNVADYKDELPTRVSIRQRNTPSNLDEFTDRIIYMLGDFARWRQDIQHKVHAQLVATVNAKKNRILTERMPQGDDEDNDDVEISPFEDLEHVPVATEAERAMAEVMAEGFHDGVDSFMGTENVLAACRIGVQKWFDFVMNILSLLSLPHLIGIILLSIGAKLSPIFTPAYINDWFPIPPILVVTSVGLAIMLGIATVGTVFKWKCWLLREDLYPPVDGQFNDDSETPVVMYYTYRKLGPHATPLDQLGDIDPADPPPNLGPKCQFRFTRSIQQSIATDENCARIFAEISRFYPIATFAPLCISLEEYYHSQLSMTDKLRLVWLRIHRRVIKSPRGRIRAFLLYLNLVRGFWCIFWVATFYSVVLPIVILAQYEFVVCGCDVGLMRQRMVARWLGFGDSKVRDVIVPWCIGVAHVVMCRRTGTLFFAHTIHSALRVMFCHRFWKDDDLLNPVFESLQWTLFQPLEALVRYSFPFYAFLLVTLKISKKQFPAWTSALLDGVLKEPWDLQLYVLGGLMIVIGLSKIPFVTAQFVETIQFGCGVREYIGFNPLEGVEGWQDMPLEELQQLLQIPPPDIEHMTLRFFMLACISYGVIILVSIGILLGFVTLQGIISVEKFLLGTTVLLTAIPVVRSWASWMTDLSWTSIIIISIQEIFEQMLGPCILGYVCEAIILFLAPEYHALAATIQVFTAVLLTVSFGVGPLFHVKNVEELGWKKKVIVVWMWCVIEYFLIVCIPAVLYEFVISDGMKAYACETALPMYDKWNEIHGALPTLLQEVIGYVEHWVQAWPQFSELDFNEVRNRMLVDFTALLMFLLRALPILVTDGTLFCKAVVDDFVRIHFVEGERFLEVDADADTNHAHSD